jgi:elongation factor G
VVDLVKMRAIVWDDDSQGVRFEYTDIPPELAATAKEWHDKMVEAAAEASEELLERYLSGEPLSEEEIKTGLRARWPAKSCRCSAAARSRTRACRRCSTP